MNSVKSLLVNTFILMLYSMSSLAQEVKTPFITTSDKSNITLKFKAITSWINWKPIAKPPYKSRLEGGSLLSYRLVKGEGWLCLFFEGGSYTAHYRNEILHSLAFLDESGTGARLFTLINMKEKGFRFENKGISVSDINGLKTRLGLIKNNPQKHWSYYQEEPSN